MTKKERKLSSFLTLVLKHAPETIDLTLDPDGWAPIKTLLPLLRSHGKSVSRPQLEALVATSLPPRFEFSPDGHAIRASSNANPEGVHPLEEKAPPSILYHGTCESVMHLIEMQGLIPQSTEHVHLTSNIRTAHIACRDLRHPIILEIAAASMAYHDHVFLKGKDDLWLTASVPPDYLAGRLNR